MRALWHIAMTSRCWSSRQAATIALKAVMLADEAYSPVQELTGSPLPDDLGLEPKERPDLDFAAEGIEDFMGMWSGRKPR